MQNPFTAPHYGWVAVLALQVVQGLTLFPWLLFAGLAVMAFDAPGSEKRWEPWAFVLAIWSYPLWLALAAAGSWIFLACSRRGLAISVAILATLPMPALLLLLALSPN